MSTVGTGLASVKQRVISNNKDNGQTTLTTLLFPAGLMLIARIKDIISEIRI